MQGVAEGRGKKGHLHGREEDAGKRARQDAVRLQDQDQSAGKCGLRMVLSQDCELCNSCGGSMDSGLDDLGVLAES